MENAITDINIVERKLLANIKRRPGMYNDFVAVKLLGHNKTVLNYCSLIYETEGDEDKAVNMFFELLNECLISQGFEPISDCED